MNEKAPIGSHAGDEQAFRVAYLVAGSIRNTLTPEEDIELDNWVTASMENQRLFEKLVDERNIDQWLQHRKNIDTEAALKMIKGKILKRRSVIRSLLPYAAAACLIAALVYTYPRIRKQQTANRPAMVQTKPADIAPGTDRATLILSDGTVVQLDSVKDGRSIVQGRTSINKVNSGQLTYELMHLPALARAELYNTLTVPAGGQFKVVLPDGTHVWINAASSLRYPTVFSGARRTVELSGEAYFEVAKDPMFPFEVKANGATVQVLGTHFNVNAYTDEPSVKVALAEGSVKLNGATILKPGEEGRVSKNRNIEKGKTDLETTLAWKNGQFIFKEAPLEVVMRQVARWYSAGIVYDAAINKHFNAAIPRNTPVSKLLHLLEATGEVHFSIDNNKITVMK